MRGIPQQPIEVARGRWREVFPRKRWVDQPLMRRRKLMPSANGFYSRRSGHGEWCGGISVLRRGWVAGQ